MHVGASWNVGDGLELDTTLSWVDRVEGYDIPSFLRLDARFGWEFRERSTFELVLQNVLDDRHPEFGQEAYWVPTELEHGVFFRVTHGF